MRHLALVAFLVMLAACATSPTLAPLPAPDDSTAPVSDAPYRPVMAGTVYHGLGSAP